MLSDILPSVTFFLPRSIDSASTCVSAILGRRAEARLTGCQLFVLEIDLYERGHQQVAHGSLTRLTYHLLKPERDYVGTVNARQDVAQELEVVNGAVQIAWSRCIDVPRDREKPNSAERAEVGLTKVKLGVYEDRHQ